MMNRVRHGCGWWISYLKRSKSCSAPLCSSQRSNTCTHPQDVGYCKGMVCVMMDMACHSAAGSAATEAEGCAAPLQSPQLLLPSI